MERRFGAVVVMCSPFIVALNYTLKYPFSSPAFALCGSLIGGIISVILLLLNHDRYICTVPLRLLFTLNLLLSGGYAGYSCSIGLNSYQALGSLGVFSLIIECMSSCYIIGLTALSLHEPLKRRLVLVYEDCAWTTNTYLGAIFVNLCLAEILGNTMGVAIGFFYLVASTVMSFVIANIVISLVAFAVIYGILYKVTSSGKNKYT